MVTTKLTDEQKAQLERLQAMTKDEQIKLAEEEASKAEQAGNALLAKALRREIEKAKGAADVPTAARAPKPLEGIPSARELRTGFTGSRPPRESLFSRPPSSIPPSSPGVSAPVVDVELRRQLTEVQAQVAELRRLHEQHGKEMSDVREGLNTVYNLLKDQHSLTSALHSALTSNPPKQQ